MWRFQGPRTITVALLLALGALAAGCGDDDTSSDPTPTTSRTVEAENTVAVPPGAPGGAVRCEPDRRPRGIDYEVANLPSDDSDAELAVHTSAAASTEQTATLQAGDLVTSMTDPAKCLLGPEGDVWWEIRHGDGDAIGWVNSRFLNRLPTLASVDRQETCRLYRDVLDLRTGSGTADPLSLTSELDAQLNGPPAAVAEALRSISGMDDAGTGDAYDDLMRYMEPLCD